MIEQEQQLKEALAENFEIEAHFSSGNMGHVFRARDLRQARRPVAIKVLRPEYASSVGILRFLREIEITSKLENAHIVPVFYSGRAGDLLYYVMPWVEGESLAQRVEREGRLPLRDAVRITDQVLNALEYAHGHGVIHRDIKPANVLLSGRDARLTDFGIARPLNETVTHLTQGNSIIGTPMYMSPEQATGRDLDARSDLYSLGCVLYEMLTGKPPFPAESPLECLMRRVKERPPSVRASCPDLPDEIDRFQMRAMACGTEERFTSAAEMANALDTVSVREPVASTIRVRWTWTAVATGLALIAAVVGLRIIPRQDLAPSVVTLAVLPLDNVSGDGEQEWFADAMTSELIREVSQVPGLRVIARTSVLRYRDSRERTRDMARELGAQTLLEGTIQRAGDTVRISATLVDGNSESNLWSGEYDRPLGDVLRLQREVARDIAQRLHVRLSPRSHRRGAVEQDPLAYEAYLEGRAAWSRRTLEGFQEAIQDFERAIALSPQFADAHSGLADIYTLIWFYGVLSPGEAYTRARMEADKALALDSTCADAWASLGVVHSENTWQWEDSERSFLQALRWNPNHAAAHQWYSELLSKLGRTEDALEQIEIARGLDPLSPLVRGHVGTTYYFRHEPERALPEFAAATALDSSYWLTRLYHGLTLAQVGRIADATYELNAATALAPGNTLPPAALGYVLARDGHPETARAFLAALEAPDVRDRVPPTHRALLHVGLGETRRALDDLERAYEVRDPLLSFLHVAPALDPLRSQPRFEALLDKMRYPVTGGGSGAKRARPGA